MQCLNKSTDNKYTLSTNDGAHKYTINGDDIICPLGSGSFATVFKAYTTIQPQTAVAVKQISKDKGMPQNKIMEEIKTMKKLSQLNQTNILYILDWCEDQNFVYIITPLCDNGTLTKYISQAKLSSELEVMEYFRQICYGLSILHMSNIIHRDLKTDNVLLNSYSDNAYPFHNYLLLSDYGLSKEIMKDTGSMTLNVGTPYTRAPEVYTGNYSYSSDIYSLGCILYKMLTKREFLSCLTEREIIDFQQNTRCVDVNSAWKLSQLTLSILEGCLQLNQGDRITMNDLMEVLDLSNLYTDYKQINLEKKSANTKISLKGW